MCFLPKQLVPSSSLADRPSPNKICIMTRMPWFKAVNIHPDKQHTYCTYIKHCCYTLHSSASSSFALPSLFLSLPAGPSGCRPGLRVIHEQGGRNVCENHMSFQFHAFHTHTHAHTWRQVRSCRGAHGTEGGRCYRWHQPLSCAPSPHCCVVTGWYMGCCIGTDMSSHLAFIEFTV